MSRSVGVLIMEMHKPQLLYGRGNGGGGGRQQRLHNKPAHYDGFFQYLGRMLPESALRLRDAVALWLRHYATSRKDVGSSPEEVNELFQFT
jgi:hypothetical protein